ncbi:hypothetical protein B0H16DRAFT_1751399 [Mycena metata]|uniref:MYND-type domain-containing protein n=1 Tax=Mycena metata TaxID=1033252 RepID=A0AAD7DL07_9AGAR|nr:hypothetical protein B0H16DRAFT_1751399 [Mycena metata]
MDVPLPILVPLDQHPAMNTKWEGNPKRVAVSALNRLAKAPPTAAEVDNAMAEGRRIETVDRATCMFEMVAATACAWPESYQRRGLPMVLKWADFLLLFRDTWPSEAIVYEQVAEILGRWLKTAEKMGLSRAAAKITAGEWARNLKAGSGACACSLLSCIATSGLAAARAGLLDAFDGEKAEMTRALLMQVRLSKLNGEFVVGGPLQLLQTMWEDEEVCAAAVVNDGVGVLLHALARGGAARASDETCSIALWLVLRYVEHGNGCSAVSALGGALERGLLQVVCDAVHGREGMGRMNKSQAEGTIGVLLKAVSYAGIASILAKMSATLDEGIPTSSIDSEVWMLWEKFTGWVTSSVKALARWEENGDQRQFGCEALACGRVDGKAAMKRCKGCKRACYCSRECQRDDWAEHKQLCAMWAAERELHERIVVTRRDRKFMEFLVHEDWVRNEAILRRELAGGGFGYETPMVVWFDLTRESEVLEAVVGWPNGGGALGAHTRRVERSQGRMHLHAVRMWTGTLMMVLRTSPNAPMGTHCC